MKASSRCWFAGRVAAGEEHRVPGPQGEDAIALGEIEPEVVDHALGQGRSVEVDRAKLELRGQDRDHRRLGDEAHLDDGAAEAPAPLALLQQRGVELLLGQERRVEQQLPKPSSCSRRGRRGRHARTLPGVSGLASSEAKAHRG
jgi:hypothetical protein